MSTGKYKRKLTAVFSSDVAGYSRLMGEDEAATVKTLEAYKQVMFSLDYFATRLPNKDQAEKDKHLDALRKAGMK